MKNLLIIALLLAQHIGVSQTQLTNLQGWEYHAMYNPTNEDSVWFVYSYDDNRNVYIKDLNTGIVSSLNIDSLGDYHFDITSDGKRMVFDAYTSGNEPPYSLYIYDLETNAITHLVERSGYPSFSPDGQKVALNYYNNLCTMDINTGNINQLTFDNYDYECTHWSPDEQKIVTGSNRVGGNSEIWTFNVDGSGSQQITNNPARDYWGKWSPDGTQIIFVSERTGNSDLWLYTLSDSSLEQLTDHPTLDHQPSWSSDGSKIIFTSWRAGTMDLWELDLQTNAIEILNHGHSIKVYPTPTNEKVNIEFNYSKPAEGVLSILNIEGEKLLTKKIEIESGTNLFNFDLSNIVQSGNYIVKISSDGWTASEKIVYINK